MQIDYNITFVCMSNTISIIIAEDHPIYREALHFILSKKSNYNVVAVATNGIELVELATKHNIDLILTDIEMPMLTGIEAVRILKEQDVKSKIIVLTLFADDLCAQEMKMAGADFVFNKSIDGSALFDCIDSLSYLGRWGREGKQNA